MESMGAQGQARDGTGTPKRGPVGGGPPAEGPGEAPKDYTKPRQTIESPNRLYKAPKRLYKDLKRLYKATEY